jgi:endonuclease YncB( thermonuclease family)
MPFSIRLFRRFFPVWRLVVLVSLLTPSLALAVTEYQAKVIRVMDCDILEVLHNQRPERVRLWGIDCPEKGEGFGTRAKQAASQLAFGKEVTLQTHGHDKYGRMLAEVLLPDGMNLNQELVKQGWCWWYRKYAPMDTVLEGLERDAREAKKGLWADPKLVPSWAYRGSRRSPAFQ